MAPYAVVLRRGSVSLLVLRRPLSSSALLQNTPLHVGSPQQPPPEQQQQQQQQPLPPSSLSSRMSFVFDQLDALHRDRQDKHDALQRIRAWRHSKTPPQPPAGPPGPKEDGEMDSLLRNSVQLVHPWPEWIELLERLLQQNYFDFRRVNDDGAAPAEENSPSGSSLSGIGDRGGGPELTRDWAAVCTAIENFGKDRFDILKSLSRKDIQLLVGHGCPSAEGKVVYSAKLLRKFVRVDEGDVCSACSLRSTCKRGFLVLPKEDEARTLDVMRVLLTFAFDSISGSVKNEPLMKMKPVKTVIRKLLHEIVKLSAVPIDPNVPRPIIKKAPPKVKQPQPTPKRRVGRDDIDMKKGDWLCPKCDFMNFAKNAICLQCDAKRPKRHLLPGEWECPQCSFLNYRRNMACFHCECKRPADDYMENQVNTKQLDRQTTRSKNERIPNVADAWNLDFDDNESDGADVAAFEFADPPAVHESSMSSGIPNGVQGDCNSIDSSKREKAYERRYFSVSDRSELHGAKAGFDDFDDEEDDVDNYEIVPHGEHVKQISHRNLSEFDTLSDSEDFENTGKPLKGKQNIRTSFSDPKVGMQDSDSDVDLSSFSSWKSNTHGRSRYCTSDSDLEVDSDYNEWGRRDTTFHPKESSRQRPFKHGVGRTSSEQNGRREAYKDGAHDRVRPIRRDGLTHERPRKEVPNKDDFVGSRQRYGGGMPQKFGRPLRGERSGYNQNKYSENFYDRSFDDKPRRRVIER